MARWNKLDDVNGRQFLRKGQQPLVLVLVTLVVGLPLILGRALAGHDVVTYLINAQQTAANLRAGEVFPAWGGGFNAGFGSPMLIFFPPFTSYVDAVPALLGMPIITGLGLLALIAELASGLAVLVWLGSAGLQRAALPAAIVYMVAPYRLIDLYQRTALAEHWSFVWPPLILWAAASRRLRAGLRIPLIGLLVAALLLTNLPLAVLFGLGLAAWFIVSIELRGRRLAVVAGAALGFALASFALVPQALASVYLNLEPNYSASAGTFRPSANTLFSELAADREFNASVSFALLATCALAVVAFILLPASLRRERKTKLLLFGALICLLAVTPSAGSVWEALPIFSRLQFPWRVAAPMTVVLVALVGRLRVFRAWLLVLITVFVAQPYWGWGWTLPRAVFSRPEPPPAPPGTVLPDPRAAWEADSAGTHWAHENLADVYFLPRSMQDDSFFADLAGNHSRDLDAIRFRPAVLREDPSATVRVVSWGAVKREVEVDSATGGTLVWRSFAFPDMEARVDGRKVPTSIDPTIGLLTNPMPAGHHIAEWSWHPFPALRQARIVTLGALLVTIALGAAAFVCSRTSPMR